MQIKTNQVSTIYKGKIGDAEYKFDILSNALGWSISTSSLTCGSIIWNLAEAFNLYRDLGAILNDIQPGLTLPLPDGDPNIPDAMMLIDKADTLTRQQAGK